MANNTFANEVKADGPSGFWRLGEPSGSTTAADASGNGNDGSCSGGITFGLPGFHGGDTSALFNGLDGRIFVPNSSTLNPPRITMEGKVRWDGPTNVQQRILEKQSYVGTPQFGLSVLPNAHVFVELRMKDPSPVPIIVNATSTGLVALGSETHVAATYDGLIIRIYLNGVLDSAKLINTAAIDIDTKWPHPSGDPEVSLTLGDRWDPPGASHRTFNGLIDEVAVYPTALSPDRILAHYQAQFVERVIFQYAVKFICGKSDGKVVAPGSYFTAINVHNPTYRPIVFRVKRAIALPGLKPGPVSPFRNERLGPDQALEIDCPDIFHFGEAKGDFFKGFIVIESEVELDVVAVYTAAGRDGEVETLHMERVPPRARKAEAGLGLDG